MKPVYRCGYQSPSLIKVILSLSCFLIIPYLLTLMIKNLVLTNSIKIDQTIFLSLYPIGILIELAVISSCHTSQIYLFYNNFMLYKEKLTLKDCIALFFAKDDLARLENILTKRNYINISKLKIIVNQHQYMRTNENYINIIFKLIFDDNKSFTPSIYEGTKESYKQFLDIFINYHIDISDPYHLIEGLDQPLRLADYFKANP